MITSSILIHRRRSARFGTGFPCPIRQPLLRVANDLDGDSIDQQCPEVRLDALGRAERDRSKHLRCEPSLDLVCAISVRLDIDVARPDRNALERQGEAARQDPYDARVLQFSLDCPNHAQAERHARRNLCR